MLSIFIRTYPCTLSVENYLNMSLKNTYFEKHSYENRNILNIIQNVATI